MEDANDDELVFRSSREVLEVNRRGKDFYNTMRYVVERACIRSFHLQYINQSNHM